VRSGAQTLTLLAGRLSVPILKELIAGPKRQAELRRAAGSPAQTTLRAALRVLEQLGVVEKRRLDRFPGALEHELTASGRDLLRVMDVLDLWLQMAPEGPLSLESAAGKAAIKALVDGWSTSIMRALAAKPLSLTELDSVISSLSYPAIERRLAGMRLVGQIEAVSANGRRTPYAATDWLRKGVAPLAVAAWWERRHLADKTAAFGRLDIEAALLMAAPITRASVGSPSTCRIAAALENGERQRLAGAMLCLGNGGVVSCVADPKGDADAWALGPIDALLAALVVGDHTGLELGGSRGLARSILEGIHNSLLGTAAAAKDPQPGAS
jgi:DNA-binding HxlR family transcriptional regulator